MFKNLQLKFKRKKCLSIADEIQVILSKVHELSEKDDCEEHKLTIQHLNGARQWQVMKANMLKDKIK